MGTLMSQIIQLNLDSLDWFQYGINLSEIIKIERLPVEAKS